MTARNDLHELINRLDDVPTEDELEDIIQELRDWSCAVYGHDYTLDMCGYWQHQFCLYCQRSKYPDLARKRCSELDDEMGGMTEAEYIGGGDDGPTT